MCDFFKDLELTEEDINVDLNSLKEDEELSNTTITDADKFIIAGWWVNEKNLSDERIIEIVKFITLPISAFDTFDNKIKIIHNQIDKRETLVIISCSQMQIRKKSLATCFHGLLQGLGIKECNVLIMLDKTPHTFHIPTIGILEDAPKPFEDLWDFIVKHDIRDEHTFAIELNPIINLFEGKIFKRENLVIVNINSPRTLDRQEMEKIENIMRRLDVSDITIHPVGSFCSLLTPSSEEKFIPIFLMKKEEMPTFEERWEGIKVSEEYKIYEPKGTILGYYSKDDVKFCDDPHIVLHVDPHIVLCPETIEQCSEKATIKISFEVLFAKVLLHEFAHVLMDNEQLNKDLFSKAMEESLANMIALQVFSKYDISNYDRVRSFIVNDQPTIYQFGAYQFKINADWKKWKKSNKNMPTLKTWFDKCFKEGKIRENLIYSLSDYDEVFI